MQRDTTTANTNATKIRIIIAAMGIAIAVETRFIVVLAVGFASEGRSTVTVGVERGGDVLGEAAVICRVHGSMDIDGSCIVSS